MCKLKGGQWRGNGGAWWGHKQWRGGAGIGMNCCTTGNVWIILHRSKSNEKPQVDLKRVWLGKYGYFCSKLLWRHNGAVLQRDRVWAQIILKVKAKDEGGVITLVLKTKGPSQGMFHKVTWFGDALAVEVKRQSCQGFLDFWLARKNSVQYGIAFRWSMTQRSDLFLRSVQVMTLLTSPRAGNVIVVVPGGTRKSITAFQQRPCLPQAAGAWDWPGC